MTIETDAPSRYTTAVAASAVNSPIAERAVLTDREESCSERKLD